MPKIKFTQNPKLPRDWADKPYVKDYEADLSVDEANRWVNRGVAVFVDEVKVKPVMERISPADVKEEVKTEEVEVEEFVEKIENSVDPVVSTYQPHRRR